MLLTVGLALSSTLKADQHRLGEVPQNKAGTASTRASIVEQNQLEIPGRVYVDGRLRLAHVDEAGFPKEATSTTLRLRFGYESPVVAGIAYAVLEGEHISAIGAEKFNDTLNLRTMFPAVADPEGTELNQGYVGIVALPDTEVRFGRQEIAFDNQRFVGTARFRQNEQTFDALRISNTAIDDWQANYAYVFNFNRVLGDDSPLGDFDSQSHLFNLNYRGFDGWTLAAYAYLLDLPDNPVLSSKTIGARAEGRHTLRFNRDVEALFNVEVANQTDYADNTIDFSLGYYVVEPGVRWGAFEARVGLEVLAGNGRQAFQTPFGTLHAFNGISDKFLVTPPDGLTNSYIKLGYDFDSVRVANRQIGENLTVSGAYHDFSAEDNGTEYGSEWSAKIALRINRAWSLAIEHAQFEADKLCADTQKSWLTAAFKY